MATTEEGAVSAHDGQTGGSNAAGSGQAFSSATGANGNATQGFNVSGGGGSGNSFGEVTALGEGPIGGRFASIDSAFGEAGQTTALAYNAISEASQYVASLNALARSLVPPTINPVFPSNLNAPAITAPIAPNVEPILYSPPPIPAAFDKTLILKETFPDFLAQPPQLLFPAAPQMAYSAEPVAPGVDLNYVYPKVNVDLPAPPQLLSISVEKFDGVTFPTLTATAPVLTAVAPNVAAFVPNAPYTDALLQSLVSGLKARIAQGTTGTNTGLPPAVEENIWNREREREYRQQADGLAALDKMEAMGYAFPPGTFVDARIKLITETNYTLVGSSRDIAVAQAKLEQDNIKQAIDSAVSIEGKLIDYANQTEQRRFDATKYATEAATSIYNAQVQAYAAIVTTYRAAIDIYVAQINGARAQVEVYQAEVAAEKLKVDANTALVEQYKVATDAALASIEVFKGEIQIIQTQAQIENLKVSIYGEQIKAYSAKAQVYATEVEGYKASVEAEGAKQQTYATSASAYGTVVQAVSKQIDAQVQVFQAQLAAKTQEYDAYKAQVQGQAEQVRAIAAQNSAVADIYRATVQGTASYNEAIIKEYETSITIAEQVTQIGVTAAKANGDLYLAAKSIATDAAKVGAQVEAQIAASALGAITFATHRASQVSESFGNSNSTSNSSSNSQGNSTSTSTSSTTGNSFSTQFSTQVSAAANYSTNSNIASAV